MSRKNTKLRITHTDKQVVEYKDEIIRLLDTLECKTISEAARKCGISPNLPYHWEQNDESFREHLGQTKKVLADSLIDDLLKTDDTSKMPHVIAKMFLIKGLRPEFRDNYKILELKSTKASELLKELRTITRVEIDNQRMPIIEIINPFEKIIEQIKNGNKSTEGTDIQVPELSADTVADEGARGDCSHQISLWR